MMWSLTSGNSSLSICKNIGKRWEIVLVLVSRCVVIRDLRQSLLFFAQDGGKSTNLGAKRSTNMLRCIRNQVLDASHNLIEQSLSVQKPTKS